MGASPKSGRPSGDLPGRVVAELRAMGLEAIPRNYELIYEFYTGTNQDLSQDIKALGPTPDQEDLDRIGAKYLGHHHATSVVEKVQTTLSRELHSLVGLLEQEQSSLNTYHRILGETYARISEKSAASTDLLHNAITVLTDATGTTLTQGREIAASVDERSSEMQKVRLELDAYKKIANTDSLTRLANRRAFNEVMSQLYEVSDDGALYSLLLVDIDHFKAVNDTYGHPVGDRILGIIANVLKANLRADVFIARTGGEEFAVVLRGVDAPATNAVAERLRQAVEATPLRNQRTGTTYGPITVSIGLCTGDQAAHAEDLYRKVDLALYTAKASGRNCVKRYEAHMEASRSDKLLYRSDVA